MSGLDQVIFGAIYVALGGMVGWSLATWRAVRLGWAEVVMQERTHWLMVRWSCVWNDSVLGVVRLWRRACS